MTTIECTPKTETQILLARQGIYDKSGDVFAYELLYRNNSHESNVDNSDENAGIKATSSVIAQLFTNLDIDSVISNKLAFINFTYTDIINEVPKLLPNDRVVIEILETVKVDQQLISAIKALKSDGYKIALDDFIFADTLSPLIEIADIIKLDVLNQDKNSIAEQLKLINRFKGKLLAEKIDNKDQFNTCVELGFDYFQGFFLDKPAGMKGQIITENTSLILRVMNELNKDDTSVEELERTILQIPKLSYRILRVANSAYYYNGKEINSLTDAIFRIGISKVKNWANVILLASNPDTSLDLTERTLIRAYMCESIAKSLKYHNADEAYTVGMFSTLDGMLNEPLPSLLSKIQLSNSLNQALLHHEGNLGKILLCVINYERGDFSMIHTISINHASLTSVYLQGISYASSTLDITKK